MFIGIDANEANVIHRVGISEYAFQILRKLYEFRQKGVVSHKFVIYLKSKPLENMPVEREWWTYKVIKPAKLWTQIGLPVHLFTSKKPDIFLTLTHYAPRISPVPTIVSVMDLSFLHFPETFKKNDLYQLKNWTEYSVRKSRRIITISQSSKNDIIKYYKIPGERIDVVHLGLKDLRTNKSMQTDLSEFGIVKKYVLFVGTLQPRKNIQRLIEAFSYLPSKLLESHQLVIVGKKGWLFDEILQAPEKFGVKEKVLFLDYVSDEDLPTFYKNAEVFVLPSLYEGFGLPVLEAMRYGCPVITSNVSSLPEAGGEAALYVDPEDSNDIKAKIEQVLTDTAKRDKMIEKGSIHYKKFTWEKAASEVLGAIEKAVTQNRN